jgi:hypothetical protein
MWNGDRHYPGEEILVDPEGQVFGNSVSRVNLDLKHMEQKR